MGKREKKAKPALQEKVTAGGREEAKVNSWIRRWHWKNWQ
jgi:hypothetical protein